MKIVIEKEELVDRLTWMLDFNYHGYDSNKPKQNLCMKLTDKTRRTIVQSIADGLEPEFGEVLCP